MVGGVRLRVAQVLASIARPSGIRCRTDLAARIGSARLSVEWWAHSLQPAGDTGSKARWWRCSAMSKYAVFFTLKGEAIARAMEQPSDRVLVVAKAVESAGARWRPTT